jgi:hypothetical protein
MFPRLFLQYASIPHPGEVGKITASYTTYVLGPSERRPLRLVGENLVEQVLMVAGQLGPLTQPLRHAQHLVARLAIKNPQKNPKKPI